ncbi:hypothetical protein F4814DRAFT_429471 [Daldinia grandis]|nr:hypothetical protein F4814DRAFT_429471 [Daldinia grandis]
MCIQLWASAHCLNCDRLTGPRFKNGTIRCPQVYAQDLPAGSCGTLTPQDGSHASVGMCSVCIAERQREADERSRRGGRR